MSAKHPLSKSYPGYGRGPSFDEDDEITAVDEWGQTRPRTRSNARSGMPPPTSWHGRSGVGSSLSRSSTASSVTSTKIRTTKSSPPPEFENPALPPLRSHNSSDDTIHTPSSASSSLSMKMPLTPQDDVLVYGSVATMMRKGGRVSYDKDKGLPPLPVQPILKKQPSRIGTLGGGEAAGTVPFPKTPTRSRAGSITSTNPMTTTPTTPKPTAMVRPLHLPQRIASFGDRPAVPVPVPGLHQPASSTSLRSRQGAPSVTPSKSVPRLAAPSMSRVGSLSTSTGGGSAPTSPISTPSLLRPKPRTGTGMTYRKSSASLGSGGTNQDGRKTPSLPSGVPHSSALNGLGIRTRSKTPVMPKVPTTVIGQAF